MVTVSVNPVAVQAALLAVCLLGVVRWIYMYVGWYVADLAARRVQQQQQHAEEEYDEYEDDHNDDEEEEVEPRRPTSARRRNARK